MSIKEKIKNKIKTLLETKDFETLINSSEGVLSIDRLQFKKHNQTVQLFYQYQIKSEPLLEGKEAQEVYDYFLDQYNQAKETSLARYLLT